MKIMLRIASALIVSLPAASMAADAGSVAVPKDHFNKAHAELIYENIQRDLDNKTSLDADALYLRIHTAVGQSATLDFDLGGLNAQDADPVFYGGVDLRYLVHDAETWRLGAHLQAHIAPNIEPDSADAKKSSLDLVEVDGGITLNGRFKLADDLILIPYAGPAFSLINLDGKPGDANEDNPAGAIAGVGLQLAEGNTLRIEARFFDKVSLSVSAGIAF